MRRIGLKVLYWLAVLVLSVAILIALILLIESRDQSRRIHYATPDRSRGRVRLMRRLVLLAAVAAATAAVAPPAAARVERSHLTVPLDRTGHVPGQVHLFVERRKGLRSSSAALFALAGGPGQAATQFDLDFFAELRPALANRQLVVFDERGTGRSDPLRCPQSLGQGAVPPPGAVSACAARLGPRRAFYTSRDSADDIEAIRRSIGVDRISLYGGSYGTYTALTYARRYPDHVESLILDSVVAPGGIDPLDRATYAAVPRMLRDVCSDGACSGVTPDPVADLARVVAGLAQGPRLGSAFDGHGGPQLVRLTADAVHDLVLGADLDLFLAAELPSAMRAAAGGDLAPLARAVRELRTSGGAAQLEGLGPELDAGENFARVCEETPMPWPRSAAPSERRADLTAAALGVGASAFSPWPAQTEIDRGTAAQCLDWPYASPESPIVDGPLPRVPALILSGTEDMRTPLENAQEVASRIPGATLVTVPHAGHGVLETDCGHSALEAFEAGRGMAACAPEPLELPPGPLPPLSLGQVPPSGGIRGIAGRTLTAVNLTFADAFEHLAGGLLSGDLAHFGLGGLRGGYMRFDLSPRAAGGLVFHHFAYVPGVTITGVLGQQLRKRGTVGRLVVGGSAAAHGVLRTTRRGVTGVLGRRRIRLNFDDLGAARSAAGGRLRLGDQLREGDDAVRRAVQRVARAQHQALLALHGVRDP